VTTKEALLEVDGTEDVFVDGAASASAGPDDFVAEIATLDTRPPFRDGASQDRHYRPRHRAAAFGAFVEHGAGGPLCHPARRPSRPRRHRPHPAGGRQNADKALDRFDDRTGVMRTEACPSTPDASSSCWVRRAGIVTAVTSRITGCHHVPT
jgi:hypothetical protein